jgi:hypothetical protein
LIDSSSDATALIDSSSDAALVRSCNAENHPHLECDCCKACEDHYQQVVDECRVNACCGYVESQRHECSSHCLDNAQCRKIGRGRQCFKDDSVF